MNEQGKVAEVNEDSAVPKQRAAWHPPQWLKLDAREAEGGFSVSSADGTFNHS